MEMRSRIGYVCALALCLGSACISLYAQNRMTVDQLVGFVRSSVQLHEDDKKISEVVKKVQLSNKLEAHTVEEMQTLGAGRLTMAALKALSVESSSLPAASEPAPKPVAAPLQAPSAQDQQQILSEITENALNYSNSLPNFICLQVTKRYVDPAGTDQFRLTDTIAERLSYFEHKEDYKVISVNGTPVTNRKHEQLGGATSSGEFGSMLLQIFTPQSQTDFHWERFGKLRDHIMQVYSFRVLQSNSQYSITAQDVSRTIVVGYHGLVFADRESKQVMRITMEADDIPADFPIRSASETLDYDSIAISGQKFVLPLKVDMRMRDGKNMMKNEAEFRLYNKFGSDSSIQFSDAAGSDPGGAEPGDKTK